MGFRGWGSRATIAHTLNLEKVDIAAQNIGLGVRHANQSAADGLGLRLRVLGVYRV